MILICLFVFFIIKDIVGLDCVFNVIEEELLIYLKFFILLYVDKIVIMVEFVYDF